MSIKIGLSLAKYKDRCNSSLKSKIINIFQSLFLQRFLPYDLLFYVNNSGSVIKKPQKTIMSLMVFLLVGEDGFEPSKAELTDLQSAPFGHLGTPPNQILHNNFLL